MKFTVLLFIRLVFYDLHILFTEIDILYIYFSLFGRILLARLEYLRETFQIKEGDFLTFDALVWLIVFVI